MNLKLEIINKINDEYEKYIQSLYQKDKKEIIDSAYEITFKAEIKDSVEDIIENIDSKYLQRFLNANYGLNDLYNDWLRFDDGGYADFKVFMQDSIESISVKTKIKEKDR